MIKAGRPGPVVLWPRFLVPGIEYALEGLKVGLVEVCCERGHSKVGGYVFQKRHWRINNDPQTTSKSRARRPWR